MRNERTDCVHIRLKLRKMFLIDLKENYCKKLTAIDTEANLLLECIDDKYLVYVEEHLNKKISKVYCYSYRKW